MQTLRGLWTDQSGLTMVEYALLLALVVVVSAAAWRQLGLSVANMASQGSDVVTPHP